MNILRKLFSIIGVPLGLVLSIVALGCFTGVVLFIVEMFQAPKNTNSLGDLIGIVVITIIGMVVFKIAMILLRGYRTR